jgi:uncharacterized protein YndB with AHSA1/START domain
MADTWKVVIDAKPGDVWAYVANLDRHAEWSPKPYGVEWLSGEPNAVGSTFRSTGWLPQDKEHAMEGRVTVNEPTTRFEVRSSDKGGEVTNTFVLTPQGEGRTLVERIVEWPPRRGAAKIILPILFPSFVRPAIQKGMNMLKSVVEGAR